MNNITKLILMNLVTAPIVTAHALGVNDVDSILATSLFYNPECTVNLNPNIKLPSDCSKYIFIDATDTAEKNRSYQLSKLLGIGISAPYIFVTNPLSKTKSVITPFTEINEEDIKSQLIQLETESYPRARSFSSNQDNSPNLTTTKYIRQEIPFPNTERYNGSQKAIFEYKVDFFSRYPFFHQFGLNSHDNKKFVRVSLVKSPGISFHATGKLPRRWVQPGYTYYQSMYYSYPEYLDKVSVTTSLNSHDVELYDFEPKNTDKNLSKFTKNSTIDINVGFSIPKLPIQSIGVKSSESITYENGNYMGFDVYNNRQDFKIIYYNKRYGSQLVDYQGYCNLIKNTSNWCWNYASDTYDDPIDLNKLNGTPYTNGFVPVFSSTYSAPYSKSGTSTMKIQTIVDGMNLLGYSYFAIGRIYYHGSQEYYNPYGKKFRISPYKNTLTYMINWDSNAFSGAEPVMIYSLKGSDHESQCLTANSDSSVSLSLCDNESIKQLFYYTPNNKKYVSAENYNKCLSTNKDYLSLESCSRTTNNNNMSWQWDDTSKNFSLLYTQGEDGIKVLRSEDNNKIKIERLPSHMEASEINEYLYGSRLGDLIF